MVEEFKTNKLSLTTNLLAKIGGGVKSLVLIFFGSAKSATFNVIVGFFVPGFGYLKINNIFLLGKDSSLITGMTAFFVLIICYSSEKRYHK